jgi:opacity protein-like surface antigen
MKRKFAILTASVLVAGFASAAEGLYYIGSEAQETMPLKWVVGMNLTYDSNVNPGVANEEDATSISPYVGLSFVNITPQTTWDVYARVGALYYFDEPSAAGSDDFYGTARAGVNLTHRFNELLRLSSRNFISYELEPDYSYGFATSRQIGEYLYWQSDDALGYRWTERLATYTGFTLTGLSYADVDNQDRFTWSVYNQFRYQLTPQQTVLTLDYRYGQTAADGVASDSTDQYLLLGVEHRFSPNTILIARAGAQFRDVDQGSSNTNPFVEMTMNSRITEEFSLKAFARYSVEPYDTVQYVKSAGGSGLYDFDQRETLRIGVSGEYKISRMFAVFGGVDYIPADFKDGRKVGGAAGASATVSGLSQDLVNLYMGLSVKFTDNLFGTLSYNYTDSSSDLDTQDYDRSRVNLGVRYEF